MRRYTDGILVELGQRHDNIGLYIPVHKYRNNSMSSKEFGCSGWTKRCGKIRNAVRDAVREAGGNADGMRFMIPPACGDLHFAFKDHFYDNDKVTHIHTGKGSPEEISEVLAAMVAADVIHPDALWDYVDDYIGLDCNGFVGNWAAQNRIKVAGSNASANLSLRYYAARNQDKKRRGLDEMRLGDVMVWITKPHIAAVEMVVQDDPQGRFIVVESSKSLGGLRASFYRLTSITRQMEKFQKENRLLSKSLRDAMKEDMKDNEADRSEDWYKEADSLGKGYKVHSYDRGTDQWVSIHGLTH